MRRTADPKLSLKREGARSDAVVKVGAAGRGFVVEHGRKRLIITAAHCPPADADGRSSCPPPHPFSHIHDRTYPELLGLLGAEPTVWAECLFVNPVADIAVLGAPDFQAMAEESKAYDALVAEATPFAIADAPKMGRERVRLPYGGPFGGTISVDTDGEGSARVLSLDGQWLECTVTRKSKALSVIGDDGLVVGGMSGSPIVSTDGKVIGLISAGGINPVLRDDLPAWFFRRCAS